MINSTAETYPHEGLSFDSLREDVEGYSWDTFRQDLWAGLNTSLVSLPQAMAFALVADLPLSCGLLAAIFSAMFSSLFGSCRQIATGPNNATAMLVQFGTAEILYTYYRDVAGTSKEILALQILSQLCLLIGIFQVSAALFKLGRLTQFVSLSVLVGYQAGTAAALVINQIFTFTGIAPPEGIGSLSSQLYYFFGHINHTHLPTLIVGLGSFFLILFFDRYGKKLPAGLIVLGCAAFAVHWMGLSSYSDAGILSGVSSSTVMLVGDTGEIHYFFPIMALPHFDFGIINQMIPMAFAIALLSTIETSLAAKTIASSSGQRLSMNQEIFGLGLANLFSSFISAMPCSASISRSNYLYRTGAKTHFAGFYNSLFVWGIVVLFEFFVERTPITALSAILIFTAMHIVSWEKVLLCIKATSSDAMVLVVTFGSCLLFGLDVAFYVGIGLSVSLYLMKAAVPHLVECTYDESGQIHSLNAEDRPDKSLIRVINVQGELFFGAADLFQHMLKTITKDDKDLKVVILRLKNARDMDATACLALQQLNNFLKLSGRHLLACGLTHPSWEVLSHSGTLDVIGKDNLFIVSEKNPRFSLQKAIIRAKELIAKDALREPDVVVKEIPAENRVEMVEG